MVPFFQAEKNARHRVRPFVAADEDGTVGTWYFDYHREEPVGPVFGDRSDDLVTSFRGALLFAEVLKKTDSFTDDYVLPCWYLGRRVPRESIDHSLTALVDHLIPDDKRDAVLNIVMPSIDSALAFFLKHDFPIGLDIIYEELKIGKLTWSEFCDDTLADVMLMTRGRLSREYDLALAGATRQRGAPPRPDLVQNYVTYAEGMLGVILDSLHNAFLTRMATVPRDNSTATGTKPSQKSSMLLTITRHFRRADLVKEAQVPSLYKAIGVGRVAAKEALERLQQGLQGQQHPDLKFSLFHNNMHRLACGLEDIINRVDARIEQGNSGDEDVCRSLRHAMNELLLYMNMSVREQMPGIYTLGLSPERA